MSMGPAGVSILNPEKFPIGQLVGDLLRLQNRAHHQGMGRGLVPLHLGHHSGREEGRNFQGLQIRLGLSECLLGGVDIDFHGKARQLHVVLRGEEGVLHIREVRGVEDHGETAAQGWVRSARLGQPQEPTVVGRNLRPFQDGLQLQAILGPPAKWGWTDFMAPVPST